MGETQRNLEKRIYENKRSIKLNDDRNALFSHVLDLKHTYKFSQAALIKAIYCKKSCRLLESAFISKTKHIKQRSRFFQISPYFSDTICHENNIETVNG